MKVLIVGSGVVGFATGWGLGQWRYDVTFYDISPPRLNFIQELGWKVSAEMVPADIYLICVPTFANYFDAIEDSAERIAKVAVPGNTVALRSTVVPGVTRNLVASKFDDSVNIVYQPEYLRSVHQDPRDDVLHPILTVLGELTPNSAHVLYTMYELHTGAKIITTDLETAELAKLMHNNFNASKISFFNEAWRLAQSLGLDGNFVNDLVSQTAEGSWNQAYGIKGGLPYGGECLPKDVEMTLAWADMEMIRAAQKINQEMGGK